MTKIPERLNITQEILKNSSATGTALYSGTTTLSWQALTDQVENFAFYLKEWYQIKKGDAILVRAMNTPEIAVSVLACMGLGAVPCMTSRLYAKNELEYVLENSRAKVGITPAEISLPLVRAKEEIGRPENLILIGDKEAKNSFSKLSKRAPVHDLSQNPTASEDPAFVMYTSGSTGVQKGVVHAHRWLLGSARVVGSEMMHLSPADIVYCPQEISFLHGFAWGFVTPLYLGASAVLLPTRSGASPESIFEALEKYRVTVFISVTTMFRNLLKVEGAEKKYDLSSLRMCVTGGDPLFPKEFEEWKRRFKIDLLETMAQTEIGIYTGYSGAVGIKPGSCGIPLHGHTIDIVDDNGRKVERGTIGHLVIAESDPGLFKEYLGMPDATQNSRKNGWYYTKDMAYVDAEGYLWYAGRSDDMFKSRGYLISPQEIEKAIMEHPAVVESCVVPIADERIGNRIKAFVCLKPSYNASGEAFFEDMEAFLLKRIAPYKVPKEVEIIAEIPKTITGKIKRADLRAPRKKIQESP